MSGITTGLGGRPRCHTCDRWLSVIAHHRYACPCCGEVYLFIEHLFGSDGPDGDGIVPTGFGANRAGHLTELKSHGLCPTPRRRGHTVAGQQQMEWP